MMNKQQRDEGFNLVDLLLVIVVLVVLIVAAVVAAYRVSAAP